LKTNGLNEKLPCFGGNWPQTLAGLREGLGEDDGWQTQIKIPQKYTNRQLFF
jgi:hypothetical protein